MTHGSLNELWIAGALVALGVTILLALYVWPNFSYSVTGDTLILRRTLLGLLPLGRVTVRLADIEEARRPHRRENLAAGVIFGNVLVPRVVVLVLRNRQVRFNLAKRIFITPDDPAAFLSQVISSLKSLRHANATKTAG